MLCPCRFLLSCIHHLLCRSLRLLWKHKTTFAHPQITSDLSSIYIEIHTPHKANMFARLSLIVSALAFFLNLATALPHFGWHPRPTGAFPHPPGPPGFPLPTGGFPVPTGGFPLPTGWPQPTGAFPTGFPTGWVPGQGPAPTGTAAKPLDKRFEGARQGGHDGFWWGNWGGNWGNWGPKPTATGAPIIPTGNAAFPTGAWGPTGTGAWGYPTAPVPVPTGY
jgi:hypothetical protein